MAIRTRGNRWPVKVRDPNGPGRQRWVGSFKTENEPIDAELAATVGVAPSARALTIRDWSMVWLRDYARPALSTQRPCCDAFRVVRQRWAERERLELYELCHACATLLMGAVFLRTSSRTSSARPTGAPSSAARTATRPSAECAIRSASRSAHGEQKRSRRNETCLETARFRSLAHPPSPYWTSFRSGGPQPGWQTVR